jgi:Na+-driven multidrug efflux pump
VSRSGPHLDADLARSLLATAAPLMGRHLAGAVVVFPLLALVATFGPAMVAAYEIARRIRGLMGSLTWGFSIAASALVGRYLGADDEREADAYGAAIRRLSLVAYLALAVLVILLARPIARAFVADPETVALAAPFVMVAAVSAVGVGVNGSATGILRGAGDTRWPFYATMVGLYAVALPAAWASVGLALGVTALYVSLVVETFVPALITWWRYRAGEWKVVGRARSAGAGGEIRADD